MLERPRRKLLTLPSLEGPSQHRLLESFQPQPRRRGAEPSPLPSPAHVSVMSRMCESCFKPLRVGTGLFGVPGHWPCVCGRGSVCAPSEWTCGWRAPTACGSGRSDAAPSAAGAAVVGEGRAVLFLLLSR